MNSSYCYVSKEYFQWKDVDRIVSKISSQFKVLENLLDIEKKELVCFHSISLPPGLTAINGLRLWEVTVTSRWMHSVPWSHLANVLVKGASTVGLMGRLCVGVGFCEKESKQNNEFHDTIYIRLEKGKAFFDYSSNGSKLMLDANYAVNAFKDIISILDLPLAIKKTEDAFTLSHVAGLELRVSGGFFGKNPSSFFCELREVDVDDLVAKARRFVKHFSTEVFESYWQASESAIVDGANPDSELIENIYGSIFRGNFVANGYEIRIACSFNDVSALEPMRNYCGENDKFSVSLLDVLLADKYRAQFGFMLDERGYRVYVESDKSNAVKLIEEILGVRLQKMKEY